MATKYDQYKIILQLGEGTGRRSTCKLSEQTVQREKGETKRGGGTNPAGQRSARNDRYEKGVALGWSVPPPDLGIGSYRTQ